MADSENPTLPQPSWSFGDLPIAHEDTSPKASRNSATSDKPTIPPPTWSFGDLPVHHDASSEAASRDSTSFADSRPTPSSEGVFPRKSDLSAKTPPPPPLPTANASGSDAGITWTAPLEETHAQASPAEPPEAADAVPEHPDSRRYKIRTCRICFDEVAPTFEPVTPTTHLLRQKPRVVYISDDPDCGRLMRPCKCKGTQKYVHEGCLKAWRMSAGADRNLWKCPTCLYEYRLNRLSWGTWVSSTAVRVGLTLLIMVLCVFLLGFVAEPVMRYLNPGALLLDYTFGSFDEFDDLEDWIPDGQPDSWSWHFTRGFFALGIAGMFKTMLFMRPWNIIRIGGGGRRRGGGRDRIENIQWVMVIIGVLMFLRTVWKFVSAQSSRALNRFSDNIVDVPGNDDDDAEEDDAGSRPPEPEAGAPPRSESSKDK